MRTGLALLVFGVLGCSQAGPGTVDEKPPGTPTPPTVEPTVEPTTVEPTAEPKVEPTAEPKVEPSAVAITVMMTAATLADDCGGGPNTAPQAPRAKAATKRKSSHKRDRAKSSSAGARRCEQSSIQLAIASPAGTQPAVVAVRSVELFAESGTSLGKLEARAPSLWSDTEGYAPWNQTITPAQDLSVSYALSAPDWTKVADRWNQTYTVKAVVSIGGADRNVEQTVEVEAPTSLPGNIKT